MTDRISAQDVYDLMVRAIDAAADEKHIYRVPEAAERACMNGGEVTVGFTQRWRYNYDDPDGHGAVSVECYWYDQSRPFSIQPDKHVMKVKMTGEAGSASHVRSYEE